jgi:hypothetical protein
MESEEKKIKTSVSLRPSVRDELKAIAKSEGRSVSNLLERFIVRLLRHKRRRQIERGVIILATTYLIFSFCKVQSLDHGFCKHGCLPHSCPLRATMPQT